MTIRVSQNEVKYPSTFNFRYFVSYCTGVALTVVFLMTSMASVAATAKVTAASTSNDHQTLVLGSGCFWGAEKRYQALPGVIDAVSGYADGRGVAATYREITKYKHKFNSDNHAEVVQVTYDPAVLSTAALLQHFFESHDPTQKNRQGNDVGTQYRSTILFSTDAQQRVAQQLKAQFQGLLTTAGYGAIQTSIKPLEQFYKAEEYHQDYIAKNPNGYCPDHSTGVVFTTAEKSQSQLAANQTPKDQRLDNTLLMTGKHIVMIDNRNYCPYCEKFKQEVANDYQGTIPMHYRYNDQLDGLTVTTDTSATPTLLFLQDGKEIHGARGALSAKDFYKLLGYFKLGAGEAFDVAFEEGTDARFCKQYELFKNTGDGVFIDRVSGVALFDTQHRFNSGTGWLSFTNPIAGTVYEKADNRYGMTRTEIRSVVSDIHLGHVFNDGPNGTKRYCINATVLEFVARADVLASNTSQ